MQNTIRKPAARGWRDVHAVLVNPEEGDREEIVVQLEHKGIREIETRVISGLQPKQTTDEIVRVWNIGGPEWDELESVFEQRKMSGNHVAIDPKGLLKESQPADVRVCGSLNEAILVLTNIMSERVFIQ